MKHTVHDDTILIGRKTLQVPFFWRPRWLLSMRFLNILGVVVALVFSRYVFEIMTISYPALIFLCFLLFCSNTAYVMYYKFRLHPNRDNDEYIGKRLILFTKVQINADLILLTLMLHFSGGATNPLVFYYIFHTILSSILLSKRAAYLEVCIATGLFGTMTILETTGIINHYYLFLPNLYNMDNFVTIILIAISSTLFFAAYLTTSIMNRLRLHQFELEEAIEKLKNLEAEKERFLNVVIHDLKSPIVAIESLVNSLLAVHGSNIGPEVKKVLERIPERTKDLVRFIKELLEFSHIRDVEQLKKKLESLTLLPIVMKNIDIYMAQADEKNITLTVTACKEDPEIIGSKDHLNSMVANLISNAIRYTHDNGTVTVTVSLDNSDIMLNVADTGIGIPKKALPNIFTNFYRAPNAQKMSTTGTGIGMSIVKTIVEEHGGTITVDSVEGEGSTFSVRIPISSHA